MGKAPSEKQQEKGPEHAPKGDASEETTRERPARPNAAEGQSADSQHPSLLREDGLEGE